MTNVSTVTTAAGFKPAPGHWTSASHWPKSYTKPCFWTTVGHKPKTSFFLHIGAKPSFFFSFSTAHCFRPRVFCPTFVSWHRPWWHTHWHVWPYTHYSYVVLSHPHVVYRPVTRTVVVPRTQIVYQDVCPYTHRETWELLAMGPQYLPAAVEAFRCLAQEHPYDGITLIGHALATARAGDYDRAVSVMRHAVRVDADALRHVPADARLDEVFIDLIGAYSQLVHVPGREVDSLFMIAALRTILHDAAAAHFAVSQAIQQGDQDASAYALRDVLTRMLSDELFPGP